jgi:hypothetical protein
MWNTRDEPGEDQIRALRRMTPAQRLEAASRLYWSARELKLAMLRQQHPNMAEGDLKRLVNEAFTHARN